jgi:hypothetical protein
VVIRRGSDASKGEDHISAIKCLFQCIREPSGIITQVTAPTEAQTPLAQQLDELRHMFVSAAAGQNFIANDDGTYF